MRTRLRRAEGLIDTPPQASAGEPVNRDELQQLGNGGTELSLSRGRVRRVTFVWLSHARARDPGSRNWARRSRAGDLRDGHPHRRARAGLGSERAHAVRLVGKRISATIERVYAAVCVSTRETPPEAS